MCWKTSRAGAMKNRRVGGGGVTVELIAEVDAARADFVSAATRAIDPDAMLVSAAKAGALAAFNELVSRHERRIFRLAQNVTQNREDAEEVMQDAFFRAFTHLEGFKGDSRFSTWLTRVAINEALMKLRKRRRNGMSLDEERENESYFVIREIEDWGPSPEQRYSQQELQQILSEAMGQLSPALRLVSQLRDVEELSTEETAQTLGISVAAVKSRSHRARLRLRETLNQYFRQTRLFESMGNKSSKHSWRTEVQARPESFRRGLSSGGAK
jgi:RNA polymerase sigma-70 factor, ECF subfamily